MKNCFGFCFLSLILGLFTTASANENRLVLKGSDTMGSLLVPRWVEGFQQENPEVAFETSARGSGMGIDSLIHLDIDIAVSSRRALPDEYSSARAKGVILKPTIVCWDGVSVVVNASNPVEDLSLAQLERIFSGEIGNWNAVSTVDGSITRYIRNSKSGTFYDFQTLAMNRRPYANSSQQQISNEAIVEKVAADPHGIGYVGLAFTQHPGIKVVRVEGVLPSVETVHEKQYPISRPNFFYTDGTPRGSMAKFIDLVLSETGQSIVKSVGFVPLD